ncbi:MAG: ABC transporter substrate-binding protein [Desulforhopalus sp.]
MKDLRNAITSRLLPFLFLLVFFTLTAAHANDRPIIGIPPAGLSTEEALRLGEVMYRKGMLPSGEPMVGFVQGDIEVSGPILTCANCHMRSGLGSYEGGVTTLPTNGAKLYAPLVNGYDLPSTSMGLRPLTAPRPAYTDDDLAGALLAGIDSAGREMSATMPHYVLDDREIEILIFYLKNLSSAHSPGATSEVLRLATVVSEGVSPLDRQSLLEPLNSFITRFPRKLILDVWELKGPQATWTEQLEKQYQQQPVFALLSGMVKGSWRPVHEFCEKNSIPSFFPITDLPVVSDNDWYTLYFSKGYYQEGEAAAKYLAHIVELSPKKKIVQVAKESEEGKALTEGFVNSWTKLGSAHLVNETISADEIIGENYWQKLASKYPDAVILIWLGTEDLKGIEILGEIPGKPDMVFVSSTMINEALTSIPDEIRKFTYITYPYGLPEERDKNRISVEQFWRGRNIHPPSKAIAEKVFSGTGLFSYAFSGLKDNRYRDYFLDLFDMMEDQIGYGVRYPRMSFGPGQRYASKGCYIVKFSELIKKSEWIIY